MKYLLDGSVLVGLCLSGHVHHERCRRWLVRQIQAGATLATCPVTEGTLLRLHMLLAPDKSVSAAQCALRSFENLTGHESWLDNFSYRDLMLSGIQEHRQITDAWLVELARRQKGRLATLDVPLSTLYPENSLLIPFY